MRSKYYQLVFCSSLLSFAAITFSAGAQTTAPYEWTWVGGSSTVPSCSPSSTCGRPGVYGTLGKPAAGNIPGARDTAVRWTDSSGHFWLFGGSGHDASGNDVTLNDLWEFNPSTNEWAWMSGSSTVTVPSGGTCTADFDCGQPGVYGKLGTPAPGNVPGGHYSAVSWADSSGNLWLFGGYGYDANGTFGVLNDLWEFNPSTNEWEWMGGSSTTPENGPCGQSDPCGQSGVYGTLGTPAPGNIPGSRVGALSWTESSGHLWLFGGSGYDANGNLGELNDLWEFNPSTNEWAWMSGSSTLPDVDCNSSPCGQPGVYGTLGTPAAGNVPGGHYSAVSWADSSGNLWFFGGIGFDAKGHLGILNDLWKFNPTTDEWAWVGGSSTAPDSGSCAQSYSCGQPGAYGTLRTPAIGNIPGGHESAVGWADSGGHFWLLGGYGYDANGNLGELNDLWEFNPPTNEWAWMDGSSTVTCNATGCGLTGVYGTFGTPALKNTPGSRSNALSWTDSSGILWLFGGYGYDANGDQGFLNDSWEYNPITATPTFSVAAGTYITAQTLKLADATSQATIYYTTNGTKPTTSSAVYSTAITVSSSETVEAIAVAPGLDSSAVAQATYIITPPAATPVFSPAGGHYSSAQIVGISDATAGASIYYTVNGTAPTTASTPYTTPIAVSNGETLEAVAIAPGDSLSKTAVATYVLPTATPVFSPAGGIYSGPQTVTLTDATAGAAIYYTLNGTNPTTASTPYTVPIAVSTTEIIKVMAIAPGDSQSSFASADYALPAAGHLSRIGHLPNPADGNHHRFDAWSGDLLHHERAGSGSWKGEHLRVFGADRGLVERDDRGSGGCAGVRQ